MNCHCNQRAGLKVQRHVTLPDVKLDHNHLKTKHALAGSREAVMLPCLMPIISKSEIMMHVHVTVLSNSHLQPAMQSTPMLIEMRFVCSSGQMSYALAALDHSLFALTLGMYRELKQVQ